jgi:hypothetical protein
MKNKDQVSVVKGPSRVFEPRERQMREDVARIAGHRSYRVLDAPLICATHGCNAVRMPGSRHCEDCDSQLALLADWRREHSGPEYAAKMRLSGERLKGFALLALFVVLMSIIGLSVWPYLFATLKLWGDLLGGK